MSLSRKRRERPASSKELAVTVQLPKELVFAIERWAELMKVAPSRAMQILLEQALAGEMQPVPARAPRDSRSARAAYAQRAAGDAIDQSFKHSGHSESVKAQRKKRLTTIPSELSRGRARKGSAR
jgi:hypothetical protein